MFTESAIWRYNGSHRSAGETAQSCRSWMRPRWKHSVNRRSGLGTVGIFWREAARPCHATISGWCHVVLYVKLYAGIFIDIQCITVYDCWCVLRFVTILLPFKSGIPGTEGVSLVSLLCFCCMSFSLILLTVRLRTFLQVRNVGMSECQCQELVNLRNAMA